MQFDAFIKSNLRCHVVDHFNHHTRTHMIHYEIKVPSLSIKWMNHTSPNDNNAPLQSGHALLVLSFFSLFFRTCKLSFLALLPCQTHHSHLPPPMFADDSRLPTLVDYDPSATHSPPQLATSSRLNGHGGLIIQPARMATTSSIPVLNVKNRRGMLDTCDTTNTHQNG